MNHPGLPIPPHVPGGSAVRRHGRARPVRLLDRRHGRGCAERRVERGRARERLLRERRHLHRRRPGPHGRGPGRPRWQDRVRRLVVRRAALRGDTAQNVVDLQGSFLCCRASSRATSIRGRPTSSTSASSASRPPTRSWPPSAEYVDAHPEKDTYLGYGLYGQPVIWRRAERGPKKERSDEISPRQAAARVLVRDGHGAWLNSKAFEYLGITPDTPSTPGGADLPERRRQPVGHAGRLRHVADLEVPFNQENGADGLAAFLQSLNALGYTSIFSPPGNGFFPRALRGLTGSSPTATSSPACAARHRHQLADRRGPGQARSRRRSTTATRSGCDRRQEHSPTRVMDNESALLSEPYADDPSSHGETGWSRSRSTRPSRGHQPRGAARAHPRHRRRGRDDGARRHRVRRAERCRTTTSATPSPTCSW